MAQNKEKLVEKKLSDPSFQAELKAKEDA